MLKWDKTQSDTFPITIVTRPGSIISPALWSVYLDMLIKEIRKQGVGFHAVKLNVNARPSITCMCRQEELAQAICFVWSFLGFQLPFSKIDPWIRIPI